MLLAAQASHACARPGGRALFAQFSRADFQASYGRQHGIRGFSTLASENYAQAVRERLAAKVPNCGCYIVRGISGKVISRPKVLDLEYRYRVQFSGDLNGPRCVTNDDRDGDYCYDAGRSKRKITVSYSF